MEQTTYQLKITLADSEPEVWRQVLVSADITLEALHDIIQRAMGWENAHDYRFAPKIGHSSYELQTLLSAVADKSETFYYTYDFESGWLHRIEIQDKDAAAAEKAPVCTGGAAACPPEETGGVWGYDELLARLEDTDDPDYLALIDKYSTFDPNEFDLKAANERLKA